MKRTITLSESDLHRIIENAISDTINEARPYNFMDRLRDAAQGAKAGFGAIKNITNHKYADQMCASQVPVGNTLRDLNTSIQQLMAKWGDHGTNYRMDYYLEMGGWIKKLAQQFEDYIRDCYDYTPSQNQ